MKTLETIMILLLLLLLLLGKHIGYYQFYE